MPARFRAPFVCVALLAILPSVVQAQGSRATPAANRLTYADYLDWEDVQSPELSPDGRQIIYTRRWIDKQNDKWESSLWIMNADGSRPRFLTKGGNARWSPDGTRIAFIAPGEPSGAQIWVRYMDAEGATTQITRLPDGPSDIEWAPDGKSIAFRMLVPQRETWNIPMPAAPKGAKWTESPRVVTKVDYRADRQGFTDDGFRQLFVVPADGGTPRQLTSGAFETGAARWMPDGKSLVFSSLRRADAEYAWRESEVYTVAVSGGEPRALTTRKGPDNNPVPSPNGQLIAYTGYDSTDATWKDAILHVMNADGSNPRALTTALDRSPQGIMWATDGSGIYFNAENEGARNLMFVSLTGQVRPVTKGAHVLSVADIHASGLAVGTASDPLLPNDIVTFNVRTPASIARLTNVNGDVLTGKQLATTEEVWYPSEGGMKIQGWIVKPAGFDPSKKYPLMLEIHGGPRGSTGYGSAFGNAIKNAYPGKDFDDLMAGVDTVINRGYIDTKRLYVFGCSGGGVLTSWIVGHTDRFAAASANCPVTNWLSFVGTTDGPSWYHNFAKYPWEDPSEHLRRSPLMYVGNVKTPTMLMTGVLDLRTPIPQTEEYYQALKMRKVPTAMLRFNNEWHGTSSTPSNWLRTQLYLRSWFEKWQGPAGTPMTTTTTMQQMDGAR
ncbi:MAG: S9 family peptidase [Gemmatimonadaceae bacterium]|nr:S9 family peptidase [Gemmatimonadaceae bacterium]